MPPSFAPISPSACFFNDHYAGTSSSPSELHISRFVTAYNIGSAIGSLTFAAASSGPSTSSPADLQLFVDLFSYPLQQLTSSSFSPPRSVACQHPMVLRSRLLKTTLLTASAATSTTHIYQVISSPNYKPIVFSDVDRYEA